MNAVPMTFKRKKLLTRPVLKFLEDQPRYVKIEAKMHLGKDNDKGEGDKKKAPATLCDVIDLTTGEFAQIILAAVVKSVLTDEYPNDDYVGKCFMICKRGRAPGKQYNSYDIEEVELPAEAATDSTASGTNGGTSGKSRTHARG